MKKQSRPIELLAPAGNIDAGYAALHYGADAVYLGLSSFSARAHAVNFSIADLADITGYAHSLPKRRKIYVAMNTLIFQNELNELVDLLAAIADIGVDAVIVQDLGVLKIMRDYFPCLKAHASTQMAIHNLYGVQAAQKMGIARVTLARELTLKEVAGIAAQAEIETEVFIHGALCYSYSGLCLFSSHLYGRSGNRGECAYPCREWFSPEFSANRPNQAELKAGMIFSMKDLALPEYVTELQRIGVTALKIEGRMKSPLYVAAAVNYYRHLIDNRLSSAQERELAAELRTIFSRPWTDLYLKTRKNRAVIDNEISGHRGSPAGRVEKIVKCSAGHFLRFRTTRPIELHDGLQIDIAGLSRPFGFAVKNIYSAGAGPAGRRSRVFAAPAGANVEIPVPRGHPVIPLGAVIYSSSSQKVKRQYDFFKPPPGRFQSRSTVDFILKTGPGGFNVTAVAENIAGISGGKPRLEITRHFGGCFQPARDVDQVKTAVDKTFRKLGATKLAPGKISLDNREGVFIPASLLNAARREISSALEQEIAALSRKYALAVKAGLSAGREEQGRILSRPEPKPGGFKWSIKINQTPHLLAAFSPDDWRDLDEVIIECGAGAQRDFMEQLKQLSAKIDPTRIRLAVPVILREWETDAMANAVSALISMGWKKWQISNLGGWTLLKAFEKGGFEKTGAPLDISADWPVYVMNDPAVRQLNELGISKWTLSPEDSLGNMRALLERHAADATVIVYKDTPLMISETCVFSPARCSHSNACNFLETLFHSSHGNQIRVVNHNCRCIVLNREPFSLAAHLAELAKAGAAFLRLDFIYREYSPEAVRDLWRRFRSGKKFALGHAANFTSSHHSIVD